MSTPLVIARREFLSFWWTVPNFVVVGIALAISGVIFANTVTSTASASLSSPMEQIGLILVLVVPVLTMRALAEEARTGSLEVLLTQPVSDAAVVTGKFLGLLAAILVALAPLGLHASFLFAYGSPAAGVVASSYLGLALLIGLLVALSMLTSALTASQAVAAGVAILGGLVLWSSALLERVPGQIAVLSRVSALDRLRDFTTGTVETTNVVYFATMSAAALALATRALASRRLR